MAQRTDPKRLVGRVVAAVVVTAAAALVAPSAWGAHAAPASPTPILDLGAPLVVSHGGQLQLGILQAPRAATVTSTSSCETDESCSGTSSSSSSCRDNDQDNAGCSSSEISSCETDESCTTTTSRPACDGDNDEDDEGCSTSTTTRTSTTTTATTTTTTTTTTATTTVKSTTTTEDVCENGGLAGPSIADQLVDAGLPLNEPEANGPLSGALVTSSLETTPLAPVINEVACIANLLTL